MALNNAKKVAEVEALEQKFDLGQLQGADQLANFNDGEALKSLKKIGLISDKIADDIGKLMPDHEVRYSQAVNASISEGVGRPEALRKAIFDVYGPFIFREVSLEDSEVAALNSILEKEDADKVLSSSPELKVAVIRAKKMYEGMAKKRQVVLPQAESDLAVAEAEVTRWSAVQNLDMNVFPVKIRDFVAGEEAFDEEFRSRTDNIKKLREQRPVFSATGVIIFDPIFEASKMQAELDAMEEWHDREASALDFEYELALGRIVQKLRDDYVGTPVWQGACDLADQLEPLKNLLNCGENAFNLLNKFNSDVTSEKKKAAVNKDDAQKRLDGIGTGSGLNGKSFEEFLKESTGGAGDSELAEKVAEKKQELTDKEAALKNFGNDEAYFKGKKYEVLKNMVGRLPTSLDAALADGSIEATYANLDGKSRQISAMMAASNQRGAILSEAQWNQAKIDLDKVEADKLSLGTVKGSIGPIVKQTQVLLAAVKRFNTLGLLAVDYGNLETMLEAVQDDPQGVSVKALLELAAKINELTAAVEAAGAFDVAAAKASIEASKTELKKDEKLLAVQGQKISSVEAARRIMTTLVAADEDFKALPFEKQQQVARFALARDLSLLDTEDNFNKVAARGRAKVAELMGDLRSKERMLNFSFQVGDNTESPLKGLKVEDFKNLDSIRDKIDRKVINKSNVFYLIAFFESFEQEQGVVSTQRVELEKAAKRMIAKEIGAEDRMDDARVVKLVREAYDEMLGDAERLVGDYNGHYDEKKADWQKAEIAKFQLELEALREKYITKEIDRDEYEKTVDEVLEKARDSEIEGDLGITRDELLNQFKFSPESQMLKDFGFSVKEWAAGKAKAVGMAGLSLAGKGVLGTGKLAGSLAFQAALTPFRAVKWGAMIAARPLVGFINLFRKSPWQPYSLKETAANDVGRVKDYISEKFTGVVDGTLNNIKTVPAEKWGEVSYKYTKLSERSDFESKKTKRAADLEAKLKDSSKTPVESDVVPQFDLADYKAKLANLK